VTAGVVYHLEVIQVDEQHRGAPTVPHPSGKGLAEASAATTSFRCFSKTASKRQA
jgi:hypothetical protein